VSGFGEHQDLSPEAFREACDESAARVVNTGAATIAAEHVYDYG
jgi:hypothetical protein